MKTAILYSGALRSFDKCLPNHAWQVHRHFPGADFYLSTVKDDDSGKAGLLKLRYGVQTIATNEEERQPDFMLPPGCPPQWTPGKFYMHDPYNISVSPAAVLGQLWQLQNVWSLVKEPEQYDCFVRIRPDLWFQETHPVGGLIFPTLCHTAWWGRFGGLNDRFAIMGLEAARAYFTTFSKVNDLIKSGCPLHPESLLLASLESAGCMNKPNLRWVFATLRTNGELRHPEILASDIAHAKFTQ